MLIEMPSQNYIILDHFTGEQITSFNLIEEPI